jgi:hypothetical protein
MVAASKPPIRMGIQDRLSRKQPDSADLRSGVSKRSHLPSNSPVTINKLLAFFLSEMKPRRAFDRKLILMGYKVEDEPAKRFALL